MFLNKQLPLSGRQTENVYGKWKIFSSYFKCEKWLPKGAHNVSVYFVLSFFFIFVVHVSDETRLSEAKPVLKSLDW